VTQDDETIKKAMEAALRRFSVAPMMDGGVYP